ncbi:MAG: hypothetical protein JWM04_2611 [Verrucomicrobiales bacterium]|nr:hypothetical protein [Verrucomicrobiales bacterium]
MKPPSQPLYQPDDSHSHNKGTNPNSPSPNLQVRMQDEASAKRLSLCGAAPEAETKSCAEIASSLSESPTPLSLLPPPVKNSPFNSAHVEQSVEIAGFSSSLERLLNDLSAQFKQLRSQVRHLDKNDFLGARLDPVMMEVSSGIREMEQACAEQYPNFVPATDPAAKQFPTDSKSTLPQNSQVRMQGEASPKKQSPGDDTQTREVEPRPEIASSPRPEIESPPRRYKRIDRPSWCLRRPGEPNSRTILMEVEVIPSPQMRNIPPEFLDMENIQYYIPENDPTVKEREPFGEEWDYMLEKCYSDEAVAARKAEEAARTQRLPPAARPPAASSSSKSPG